MDDGCAGSVDECVDGGSSGCAVEQVAGTVDVDFLIKSGIGRNRRGGGGVDDDLGLDLCKYCFDVGWGGDVAGVV